MRPSFEKQLRTYSGIAKEEHRLGEEDRTDERLAHVLDWHMEQGADVAETDIETQRRIMELQRTKQEIMRRLRARLKEIDENIPESGLGRRKIVSYGGQLYWKRGRGSAPVPISLGELLTDGDWDVAYRLDPDSVPRNIRKRYAIEEAKRELREYLDTQIALQESRSRRTHEFKVRAYEAILDERERGVDLKRSGLVAERMVKNLLRKVSIDHDVDFVISDVDVYQDVENKIDFVIRRTQAERGVRVEEPDQRVGIQFTINPSPNIRKKKEGQIARAKGRLQPGDRVQDIVLVVMPLQDVQGVFRDWRNVKAPGGPDARWNPETKREIMRGVLKGFVPDGDIERYCGMIESKGGSEKPVSADQGAETEHVETVNPFA